MLGHFWYRVESLIDGQWLGWCLVAAMAATCLGCLWTLLVMLDGGSRRRALLGTLCATALTLTLAAARVTLDRRELFELLLGDQQSDPSQHARLVTEALSRTFMAHELTPPVLTLALLLVAVALVRRRELTPGRAVAVVAALLFGLSMAGAWWTHAAWHSGHHRSLESVYEEILKSVERLRHARLGVAAVAGVSWLTLLAGRRRELLRATSPPLARTATALLVLGVGSFVATRGMAWDASHLVPLDAPNEGGCYPRLPKASTPVAPTDCVALEAPILEIALDAAIVDGTRLTRPEEVSEVLQKKVELWRQLNPGQPFPALLIVQASVQTEPRVMLPWLAAASRAGFGSFAVYMQVPLIPLPTRTVGTLHKQRCCARVVLVDSAATPLSSFATWGDVARATHGRALSVSLR